ncbi:hypothetical protein IQ254_09165 [Nodosilinea sp. LEGE 07088]|uniref:hypothetical protein n=1 Tax=Nodosilinea sp. LEGE 07088 TaxID=2777968 RepID=UPI00187F7A94|nr:hypothetical protein [Nodosilinea sp. LEGE 07088]MBE9137375.1 hypothetical protein [Nodosilinea sp. LEGE 07088]
MVKSPVPQDKSPSDASESGCRPTFYMTAELLEAIEAQCAAEGNRKRSPFLAEIMELLLTSDVGESLREGAQKHRRPLIHELEANLVLFNEHIPTERIVELAEASQRNPDQMLVRLVLLGLRVYERAISRMEVEIEGGSELIS